MKTGTTVRASVAIFVSAAFFWTLLLSVSPQLHARVHPDAGRVEHNCAATMIASGNYDHAHAFSSMRRLHASRHEAEPRSRGALEVNYFA